MNRILSLVVSVAALVLPPVTSPAAQKPNIVFIYADDLGYGDVSCYGAARVTTPNVDRLAREGLRFTDAHSASATCTPSRYALLTGEYAWRKKGTGVLPGDAALIIEPGRTTVPSLLQKAGYTTGAIGKWHLGLGPGPEKTDWNKEITPGPREIGFDYSFILPATGDRVPCVFVENQRVVGAETGDPISVSFSRKVGNDPTGKDRPDLLRMHPSHGHDQTIVNGISRIGYMSGGKAARWVDEDIADVLARKGIEFIERNRSRPFFLYFATHDIHVPRVPHPRFVGRTEMGARGDVIVQFDWTVGEVLKALDRLDLAKNTLVILSSDNGPVVDDGYKDQAVEKLGTHKPAGPFRGGKYSIFEGGTRVPFVVRWPGRVKPGVSDALICQVDFLASFAALTGQALGAADGPDSFNVLPALLGDSTTGREYLVEHAGVLALRKGQTKIIQPGRGPRVFAATSTESGLEPQPQLFDLGADLGERNDRSNTDTNLTRTLNQMLDAIRSHPRSRPNL